MVEIWRRATNANDELISFALEKFIFDSMK